MDQGLKRPKHKIALEHESLGFTLLDLMIGITLSMVLTMALLQLFAITRQAYQTSTGFGEMLENANAAMTAIRNVAIRAGHAEPWTPIYAGCYKDGVPNAFSTSYSASNLNNCLSKALTANMISFALQNGNGSANGTCWTGNSTNPFKYGTVSDSGCGEYRGGTGTYTDGYYGGTVHPTNYYFSGGNMANAVYILRNGIAGITGILPFNGTDGGTGGNDKLTVIAQGEGDASTSTLRDCQGNQIGRDTLAYNVFAVVNDSAGSHLDCTVNTRTSAGTTTTKPAMTVASNIDGLRVRFAIDTDGDGVPNSYVNASTMTTQNANAKVVGIQVALLMRSSKPVAATLDKNTYTLFDQNYGPFNDRYIRRQFYLTFHTMECKPPFRKECGGVLFSGADASGNTAVRRIKAGDTVWFWQSNNALTCPSGGSDTDRAGCRMDTNGNMTAIYHTHCGSDSVGNTVNYLQTSTVSGTSVSCKAVE